MTDLIRLVKLTSGPGEDSGLRCTTALPVWIASQSPTLALILDSGFRESQTKCITLESVTPDALRQCVGYLRDSENCSPPNLESVMETLHAAKYLELDRLVELCCKQLAAHYEELPPEAMAFLDSETVHRICRRLSPLHLCEAEQYLSENIKFKITSVS